MVVHRAPHEPLADVLGASRARRCARWMSHEPDLRGPRPDRPRAGRADPMAWGCWMVPRWYESRLSRWRRTLDPGKRHRISPVFRAFCAWRGHTGFSDRGGLDPSEAAGEPRMPW